MHRLNNKFPENSVKNYARHRIFVSNGRRNVLQNMLQKKLFLFLQKVPFVTDVAVWCIRVCYIHGARSLSFFVN